MIEGPKRPGREARLWWGWRIGLFLLCLIGFGVLAQGVAALLPGEPLPWGGIVASLLAVLAASAVAMAWLERRPVGALGFAPIPEAWRETGGGLLVGGTLIAGAAALLFLTRTAVFVPDAGTAGQYIGLLAGTLLFFALAAAVEELIFRGYPFQVLLERFGAVAALLVTSALFALAHAPNPNVSMLGLVNIGLAGVLLGLAYLRTRSLWFATAVHTGWNWMMAGLLDFPVSGLEAGMNTPLYSAVSEGPGWWTGGNFGPEGGIAASLVLCGGIWWILRTRRLRVPERMQRLGPLGKTPAEDAG